MKNAILLLWLLVILSACTGGNKREQVPEEIPIPEQVNALPSLEPGVVNFTDNDFGQLVELTGEPVNIQQIIKPGQLLVKGNYLITNNQRKDSLFMIFSLPEMRCITAFGINGRGPDEFQFPRIVETMEDSILFYIYEMITDKLYKVPVKSLKPVYFITLPKQQRSLGDKQIVMVAHGRAYYAMSSEKGKSVFTFDADSIPQQKLFSELAISGLKGSWTTYIGDFGINTIHKRIAYAYKYFKRLRIIDIESKNQRDIVFKAEELAEGQTDIGNLEPTNVTHFWGMSANSDCFWMLYSGRTPVDVQQANRSGNKYIFVERYDWNGNPLKRYRLDDWGYFCVSPDNRTLYLASTAGIHSLLKYELPTEIAH